MFALLSTISIFFEQCYGYIPTDGIMPNINDQRIINSMANPAAALEYYRAVRSISDLIVLMNHMDFLDNGTNHIGCNLTDMRNEAKFLKSLDLNNLPASNYAANLGLSISIFMWSENKTYTRVNDIYKTLPSLSKSKYLLDFRLRNMDLRKYQNPFYTTIENELIQKKIISKNITAMHSEGVSASASIAAEIKAFTDMAVEIEKFIKVSYIEDFIGQKLQGLESYSTKLFAQAQAAADSRTLNAISQARTDCYINCLSAIIKYKDAIRYMESIPNDNMFKRAPKPKDSEIIHFLKQKAAKFPPPADCSFPAKRCSVVHTDIDLIVKKIENVMKGNPGINLQPNPGMQNAPQSSSNNQPSNSNDQPVAPTKQGDGRIEMFQGAGLLALIVFLIL